MNEDANILVVIPCLNEEKNIEQLVTQLLNNNESPLLRIVIADGGSTDKTAEIAIRLALRYPNVIYLHNPKRLQSAAINLAVTTHGKGCEYLIRIDAHAGYPDDYCKKLIEEAVALHTTSVVVSMDTQGKSWFQRAVAAAQNSLLGNGGSAHRLAATEGKWVDHGHHALMRIDAFQAVGGYDETFSHNEDAELDVRLTKAGYKIWLTAATRLVYHPRSSPIKLFRQYYHYGRGRVRTLFKHRTIPKVRQMLPLAVFPAALLALASPLCWLMAVPVTLWAMLCIGYGIVLGKKAHDHAIFASGIAAMIMHLSWSIGFWCQLVTALQGRVKHG